MNRTSKLYGGLVVCIFLFMALGLALSRPGLPDYAPYLSFSPDRDGVKGLRLLMEQQGAAVSEWRLAPERLSETAEGAMFVSVEPFGVTQESVEQLVAWAERGNEVVVFGGAMADGLLTDWQQVYVDSAEADGEVFAVDSAGREMAVVAVVDSEWRLEPAAASAGGVLVRDALGALAVREPVGQGAVTVAVVPAWLTNERVLEGQHLELAWMLLGGERWDGRTVYVDEYHHGYSVSPGLLQVYPVWLVAALGQAALAVAAWLWWRGKRFGPAYTPRAFVVRRGDETLLAVAGWYRRGRLTVDALEQSVARLARVLQTRGGVPAEPSAEQLLGAVRRTLAERGREAPVEALRDVLQRWESLRREGKREYGEKAWLADSMVLDETIRALEEAA